MESQTFGGKDQRGRASEAAKAKRHRRADVADVPQGVA